MTRERLAELFAPAPGVVATAHNTPAGPYVMLRYLDVHTARIAVETRDGPTIAEGLQRWQSLLIRRASGVAKVPVVGRAGDGHFKQDREAGMKESIERRRERLWRLCKAFVENNAVAGPEDAYQNERVIESTPEFVDKVCRIVGFHKRGEVANGS